jgi:hypothetical protein
MRRVRMVRDEWHDSSEKRLADASVDLVRAQAAFTGERTVAAAAARCAPRWS